MCMQGLALGSLSGVGLSGGGSRKGIGFTARSPPSYSTAQVAATGSCSWAGGGTGWSSRVVAGSAPAAREGLAGWQAFVM